MFVAVLISFVVVSLGAFGLAFWAYRARGDRSARVGLYLLFGIPAVLLLIAGFVTFATGGRRPAALLLLLAGGLGLPLLPPFRRLLATVTPLDPDSPVDMAGLCLLLTTLGGLLFIGSGALAPPSALPAVGALDIVTQAVALVVIAYIAVGWRIIRSGPEATARLGITRPTWRVLGAAVGAFVAAYALQIVVSLIAIQIQPGLFNDLDRVTDELTSGLQNPVGAAVIGIGAGVSEEAVFRGALQPRYGIFLTSILFALLHAPQYGLNIAILGLIGVSVIFGLLRRFFGTTSAMIAHALYNFAAVMIQTYTP